MEELTTSPAPHSSESQCSKALTVTRSIDCLIAVGSNLGDRLEHLRAGIRNRCAAWRLRPMCEPLRDCTSCGT